jgi:CDP-diglyceride synthetase
MTFLWILAFISIAVTVNPIFMFSLMLFASLAALWEYYAMMVKIENFKKLLNQKMLLWSSLAVVISFGCLFNKREDLFWAFGLLTMGIFLPSLILWSKSPKHLSNLSQGFCFFGLLLTLGWSLFNTRSSLHTKS